jgi:hypothetical protein
MSAGPCFYCKSPAFQGPGCCVKAMEQDALGLKQIISRLERQRGELATLLKNVVSDPSEGNRLRAVFILNQASSLDWYR